ncbi:hypothetical protein CASFOL_009289 [Castilleja foliolosa]|uniref:Uncharacterized protein n=1 Tax=Castilleja foliolosa TaxID=1961234 RepID=A0ABD3DWX1_9LAMI
MASHGKSNAPAENRPVILALECPSLAQLASSSRSRASKTRAKRVPKVQFEAVTNVFNPCILTVHTGEDIGETIRAFFQGNNLRSRFNCTSMEGRIFSVSGDVSVGDRCD